MTKGRSWLSAAAICMTLAACSGAGDKPADSAQTAAAGKKFTIAMIGKSSNNPVFLAARTGAEAAAKDLSAKNGMNIEIAWLTPPQEDGEVQAQRIRQAVNDGANAILIAASDAGKVTGAINDAVDRGVPVMTFDSDAPQSKRFAYYGVDDLKTGQLMMAELAKQLNGKGRVAILAGNQNAPNLQRRVQGAKEEAKKYPGIEVAGVFNHVETPQDAAAEVIRVNNAYPGITGWGFIGGWPLYTQTLLTDLDPSKQKVGWTRSRSSCPTWSAGSCRCSSPSRCTTGARSAWRRSSTRRSTRRRPPRPSWPWISFGYRRRTSVSGPAS